MPALMQWRGRKFAFIIACLVSVIGWILAFTATSSVTILISESFHGLGNNSLLVVSLLSMSEMVAPNIRNVSMVSFHLVQTFGMALVGIIGRYMHWRTVSLIMGAPIATAMLIGFAWPESPSWLACKGKFDECEKAFVWLRGTDGDSKKELLDLITAQKKKNCIVKRNEKSAFKHFRDTLKSKDFYMPSLHIFLLLNLTYWSGSLVILIYSIQLIRETTNNDDAAFFGGIIMNTILFVCVAISAGIIRRFNNKSILLLSTSCTITCLLCTSTCNYMQTSGWLSKESLINVYLLAAYMIATSLGVLPIVFTVAAELMPVKHRGIGGALYVIYTCILHSSSLKLAPYMILYFNLWGTLLIYGLNATVCGLLIWKFVPETKGRTLQQIEDFYMVGEFENRNHKNNCQENRVWLFEMDDLNN